MNVSRHMLGMALCVAQRMEKNIDRDLSHRCASAEKWKAYVPIYNLWYIFIKGSSVTFINNLN